MPLGAGPFREGVGEVREERAPPPGQLLRRRPDRGSPQGL